MSLDLREKIAAPPVICGNDHAHVRALFAGKRPDVAEMKKIRDCRRIALCIGTKCSLACPYCVSNMFLPEVQQLPTILDTLSVDEYLKRVIYFAQPYLPRVNFTISGGEATENPHFVKICTELFKLGAGIHLQTNVHGIKNVEAFTSQFPREQIEKRVHATVSFHCGAYIDLGERGQRLRETWVNDWFPRFVATGIDVVTVVVPMTPKVIRDLHFVAEYQQILNVAKCSPMVSELLHFYEGKPYPQSYTLEETQELSKIQHHFTTHHHCVWFDQEIPTYQSKPEKLPYLTNQLELKGLACGVHTHNLEILMDGQMRMCQSFPQESTAYGNLGDKDWKHIPANLSENPFPCPADQCLCRAFGIAYCLQLHGISLDQYYNAWYLDQNKPDVAKTFE